MLYLDVDGVFADFDSAVKTYSGVELYKDNPTKVWESLEKVPGLFRRLNILPGAYKLFNACEKNFTNIEFLTALPKQTGMLVTAQADKVWWIKKFISIQYQINCVPNWNMKKWFCTENDILVDDSERNIIEWESKGGIGILHYDVNTTIKELEIISKLLKSR